MMDQSPQKDYLKCFSLIESHCTNKDYLFMVCTTLAAPKIAPNKRKTSKIRYIFYHVVDLPTLYLIIQKF